MSEKLSNKIQIDRSLERFALQVIPSIICCRHIVQVIYVRVVLVGHPFQLSECAICTRDLIGLLSYLC